MLGLQLFRPLHIHQQCETDKKKRCFFKRIHAFAQPQRIAQSVLPRANIVPEKTADGSTNNNLKESLNTCDHSGSTTSKKVPFGSFEMPSCFCALI